MLLEEARELINENTYPNEFEPEEWEAYPESDCYTYVLNLKVNEGFLIGDFIGKRVTYHTSISNQQMILKEELEALGFEVEECGTFEDLPDDEECFKIFVEWNHQGEYHLYRCDFDGTWSHKAAYSIPIQTDASGYQIIDPESMLLHKSSDTKCYMLTKV